MKLQKKRKEIRGTECSFSIDIPILLQRGEALGASPLTELLNYVTAMSFGTFEASESK